jgi:general secretion pathway protein N
MRPILLNAARVVGFLAWAGASALPHAVAVAADSGPRGTPGMNFGLDSPPVVSTSASTTSAGPEANPRTQAPAITRERKPSAEPVNPLWSIPLASLTATRDRPIFAPTRRPPTIVQAAPVKSEPPPPPTLSPPSRPLLTLLGAIASDTDSMAIFMDETTKAIVRMKVGESHSGWMLRSVAKRQATLEMARQVAVLVIPIP